MSGKECRPTRIDRRLARWTQRIPAHVDHLKTALRSHKKGALVGWIQNELPWAIPHELVDTLKIEEFQRKKAEHTPTAWVSEREERAKIVVAQRMRKATRQEVKKWVRNRRVAEHLELEAYPRNWRNPWQVARFNKAFDAFYDDPRRVSIEYRNSQGEVIAISSFMPRDNEYAPVFAKRFPLYFPETFPTSDLRGKDIAYTQRAIVRPDLQHSGVGTQVSASMFNYLFKELGVACASGWVDTHKGAGNISPNIRYVNKMGLKVLGDWDEYQRRVSEEPDGRSAYYYAIDRYTWINHKRAEIEKELTLRGFQVPQIRL